jgi:hypothetical protein
MAKHLGSKSEKGKKAPPGTSGASVETGLSQHEMIDGMNVRTGRQEQARCSRKTMKVPGGEGYMFDGNSN